MVTSFVQNLHRNLFLLTGMAWAAVHGEPSPAPSFPPPGTPLPRSGDEIIVAGQWFHTGTKVIPWTDPGGYDAYRVERRFSPLETFAWKESQETVPALTTPNRYGIRSDSLSADQIQQVRGGGWTLSLLQEVVDQFVLHFDACGTSQKCFDVLHDHRGLSVHFLLDLDGALYQTLDLKERAWHATKSNTRSIGIEIANIGAFPPDKLDTLRKWYVEDDTGCTRIVLPEAFGDGGIRTPDFIGRPIRPKPITGAIQHREYSMYDLTPEQYAALIKLTATLCRIFPKIQAQIPTTADGIVIPHQLSDDQWTAFQGILGHYHVQSNKIDPGPAFQWDYYLNGVRNLLKP